jgi:hypothetical protein
MKKFFVILIMGALLTVNIYGQGNLSFKYKDVTYYYNQLPVTTLAELGDDFEILEVDESGDVAVVKDDGIIWVVEYE